MSPWQAFCNVHPNLDQFADRTIDIYGLRMLPTGIDCVPEAWTTANEISDNIIDSNIHMDAIWTSIELVGPPERYVLSVTSALICLADSCGLSLRHVFYCFGTQLESVAQRFDSGKHPCTIRLRHPWHSPHQRQRSDVLPTKHLFGNVGPSFLAAHHSPWRDRSASLISHLDWVVLVYVAMYANMF